MCIADVSSRFAVCTVMRIDLGKAMGTNGRVIGDNPGGFTSAERITDARSHGETDNHISPVDSRYPIPIPYELCTLTKYYG